MVPPCRKCDTLASGGEVKKTGTKQEGKCGLIHWCLWRGSSIVLRREVQEFTVITNKEMGGGLG
jgi:hypothetical protein